MAVLKKKKEEVVSPVEETTEKVNVVIDIKSEQEHVNAPSDAKTAFMKMMAAYKEQNPVKYAMKEKAFLAKLETL